MSADRNLLFGILALQLDFLTREQLITGMQAWVLAKHRPLGDVLEEMGALPAFRRQLLEPLVAEHIRQHDNDPQQSLAAVSSVESLRHELIGIPDDQLAASLPYLAAGNDHDPDATLTVTPVSPSACRFRILRPHAQGGLGRVYVAKDQELNREVALKEIQPKCAHDVAARSRFLLEAEVTGGLEHPGIVPVYGLGAYADGRPFYAMRFIKGDSLREAIDKFHSGSDGARPFHDPDKQLELRLYLGRFIDVCQAVGYAHSRGVLHRDLKPGNIMLGKYGETLVVDWGLAKAKGQQEQPATLVSEAAFTPASGSSVEPTQLGMMIGTLQYMSPEQASGRHDLLGPSTDIFSLGATLYHLLTGQPPYHEIPRERLEQAVSEGEFRPLRQINRAIPLPLEAICLKAMAREPAQRYRSAQELVADLEHFLADEPVTALSEPTVVRARRWFRKRPALTATLAASLVLGLAALGVGSLLLGQKNQELAQTNTDLKSARDKAVQNEATAVAQKKRADSNATRAEQETVRANEQTRLAGEREQEARWSAYVPAMNVAFQSWQSGYVGRAQRILDEQIPSPGQPDLRGPEWYLLWRLCRQEDFVLRGHRNRVTAVEYSPDAQTLASASDDGTVILWKVADRTIRKQLTDHQAPVKAIAFSPTEAWMATAGNDGKVRFWDTKTWGPIRELTTDMTSGGDLHPLSLAISRDGQRLVVSGGRRLQSYGSSFRVWNTTTWRELWAKDVSYAGIAISPDSQTLVVSEHSGHTRLYDLEDGRELAAYETYSFAIGYSPSGDRVLSSRWGQPGTYERRSGLFSEGTRRNVAYRRDLAMPVKDVMAVLVGGAAEHATLELWDVRRNEIVQQLSGHVGTVWSASIAPNATEFATGGEDGTVRIWGGRWLNQSAAAQGHTGAVLAASVSPDGALAATGCTDKIVCLWNARTGELVQSLRQPDRVFGLAFSPDGKWLAIASSSPVGDGLRVLAIESNREEVLPVGMEPLTVAFSPDGLKLACGSRSGQVILLDAATWTIVKSAQVHPAPIYALAFSHDGRLLATGSGDNISQVLDATSLAPKQSLQGHTGAVRGVSFSVDDIRLATTSLDASIKVWNLESGALSATLVQKPLPAYSYSYGVAFSSDGKSLVGLFNMQIDSELRIFDATTLAPAPTLSFPRESAYALALSRDGQQAIIGMAGRALISGLTDASPTISLGNRSDCYSCAFSPDGSKVVIGSHQSATIVDVATRRVLCSWKAGTEPITSVLFVGGGRQVATLEADITKHNRRPGTVRIWDAATGAEVASHASDNQYGLAALSPKGNRLALASFAHQGYRPPLIEIWDTEAWKPIAKVPRPVNIGYGSLAISPNGQTLAAGQASYFDDNPGSIWLFTDGATMPYAELRGHASSVTGLVFLDEGQTLVSAGNDQCLRVWDVRTGEMRQRLDVTEVATRSSGGVRVSALAATPGGDRIAALCDSGSLRIWETRSWQEVGSFLIQQGDSSSLAISPDGTTILVTSGSMFGTGHGYEFFEIASPARVAAHREADARFAGQDLQQLQERQRAAAPHLKAVGDAHARGDVAEQDLNLAIRLLRTDPAALDATDRECLGLIEAVCRGDVPWTELSQRLAKVEPAEKRKNREERAAIDEQKAQRARRVAELLAEAKANDSPDKAPQAMDALTTLLRYDPAHSEARQLRAKVEAYHPRETITNSLQMKLGELRPARFWMGSRLDEEGRNPDEMLHPVRLTKSCYIGAHEVTRRQFAQFVEAAGYATEAECRAENKPDSPTWRQPGFEQADDHPVVMVSWNDTRAFCDWLSKKEGKTYRLPTEAEWELAARAGTITPYIWGQRAEEGEGWGNLAGQELKGKPAITTLFAWTDQAVHTSPVGKFKPNSWGLFDLVGNVSEWCQDQYQAYPLAIEDNPQGGKVGTPPVVRGSSWSSEPTASRSAFRHRVPAKTSSTNIGFRIVLDEGGL